MKELKEVLVFHENKYPMMQVQDAVKLIYQNEFGPGHLLTDLDKAYQYLNDEIQSMEKSNEERAIPIGNNLVRYNIDGLIDEERTRLIHQLKETAESISGNINSFKSKLNLLVDLKKEGYFNFTLEQLLEYIEEYSNKGYPMVSHTEVYRQRYKPHYRVIKDEVK